MKRYLVRWVENGVVRSGIFNPFGIRRLMQRAYEERANYQVCVYSLSDSDVYMPPITLRPYYDWKYNKLTLFSMAGLLVDKAEGKMPVELIRRAAA